jgi:hypothetical protein
MPGEQSIGNSVGGLGVAAFSRQKLVPSSSFYGWCQKVVHLLSVAQRMSPKKRAYDGEWMPGMAGLLIGVKGAGCMRCI